MPARVLHLSDLHVGAHDEGRTDVEEAVRALVGEQRAELVLATGDLTHRNRPEQHERAATFLRSLGTPLLVIPGNHDIPPFPPARIAAPFLHFDRVWGRSEPVHRSDQISACGLNSVRPWKYQRGAVSSAQLARTRSFFAGAPVGSLRIVAIHHHLATPPWRTGKRTVPGRSSVLAALGEAGAEIVAGGHTHQGLVVARHEFQFVAHDRSGVLLCAAAGLGRPRPGRHAEAAGVHLYEADEHRIRVLTYAWDGRRLELIAERYFPRRLGQGPVVACPT